MDKSRYIRVISVMLQNIWWRYLRDGHFFVAPWSSGYHYCTTSFNTAWILALGRFKSCSRRVGDSWWRGSLMVVLAGNKAKRFSSVNHTTKQFIIIIRDHSFSTCTKFSEKPTFLTPWYAQYQGVRNISFSEYFAYVLNE